MADLRENVIEFYENEERATVTFTQGRYKTQIKKLAAKHPEECQIIAENEDGSLCAHVPTSWISVRPPKKLNLTEEERALRGEILRANRNI